MLWRLDEAAEAMPSSFNHCAGEVDDTCWQRAEWLGFIDFLSAWDRDTSISAAADGTSVKGAA